jgi:hypothetical protein
MNMKSSMVMLSVPLLLALGGCGKDDDGRNVLSTVSEKGEAKVAQEMATQNLTLDGKDGIAAAELTPEGDLIVDGKKVPMDAGQRTLALRYRSELAAIASAGAAVGVQGAELATHALAAAASSVVDGDPRSVEERIQGQTDEIRKSARAICDRLPALLKAQTELVVAVPQFAPYADADHTDIDECESDLESDLDEEATKA